MNADSEGMDTCRFFMSQLRGTARGSADGYTSQHALERLGDDVLGAIEPSGDGRIWNDGLIEGVLAAVTSLARQEFERRVLSRGSRHVAKSLPPQ